MPSIPLSYVVCKQSCSSVINPKNALDTLTITEYKRTHHARANAPDQRRKALPPVMRAEEARQEGIAREGVGREADEVAQRDDDSIKGWGREKRTVRMG